MTILVFAPHRDDEILGVGGTLLKRKAEGHKLVVCIVTADYREASKEYTMKVHHEMEQSHQFCKIDETICLPFLPVKLETYSRTEFNGKIIEVVKTTKPDEVYLPHWGDMQKDHQMVTEAAMVALRPKTNYPKVKKIYAYETLSETGWNIPNVQNNFMPNVYEDISDFLEMKKQALGFYQSQLGEFPDPRSIEAVETLAKMRGSTVNMKAAEAFMLIRELK